MGKMLTNNLGLKLLSLGLAIVLWLAILTVEDPVTTRDFSDIKVTEVNGEQLTEKGQAYSYTNGDTVSIRVEGKSSIVGRLTANDFEAVADMSKLSITGAVVVDVSCPRYPSVEITPIGSGNVLTVDIEAITEKSLSVRVVTNGKAASDKYVGTGKATPNLVTISGPASEIGKVKEAVAYVTVNTGISNDINTNTSLVLLDSDGNEINTSTIKCSQSDIHVVVPVYETKTVPVRFDVTGEAAEGYQVMSVAYEPKEVTIAGSSEALAGVSEIIMSDYDLSDKAQDIETSLPIAVNLEESLPEGVIFTDNDISIALAVKIEPIRTTTVSIPFSRIQIEGKDEAYTYELSSEDDNSRTLQVEVSAPESVIRDTASTAYTASVDVLDYDTGEYVVPVSVTPPEGVTITEIPEITVTISEE